MIENRGRVFLAVKTPLRISAQGHVAQLRRFSRHDDDRALALGPARHRDMRELRTGPESGERTLQDRLLFTSALEIHGVRQAESREAPVRAGLQADPQKSGSQLRFPSPGQASPISKQQKETR